MKLGLAVTAAALFAGVLVARRFGQPTGRRAHTFARRLDRRRPQRAGYPWWVSDRTRIAAQGMGSLGDAVKRFTG